MSIKVADLAYCRLQVPDLDKAEQFLTDFGLIRTSTEAHRRFFRPTDPTPYCYIVEEGPAHFLGFAFHARSRADLDLLAKTHGKQVEEMNAPGGGWRVRLQEPNGYDVDVVFGIQAAAPIEVKRRFSGRESCIDSNAARSPPSSALRMLFSERLVCGKRRPGFIPR